MSKLGTDSAPRRRASDSWQLRVTRRAVSNRAQRSAQRTARNTRTRTAKIITAGVIFDVTATTTRDFVGNERTRYSVLWNGGGVEGTFSAVCKQVAATFGQPCATHLLGRILCKLPPNGVSWPDQRGVHSLFASTERSS